MSARFGEIVWTGNVSTNPASVAFLRNVVSTDSADSPTAASALYLSSESATETARASDSSDSPTATSALDLSSELAQAASKTATSQETAAETAAATATSAAAAALGWGLEGS